MSRPGNSDWRAGLPTLVAGGFTLRELRIEDAPSLLTMLATEEVARFLSPPPTSVAAFERFIRWAHAEREGGNYVCFAVVPNGMESAIGLFQLRSLAPGFVTAEWGFALGSRWWGTGMFQEGARLILDFAFDVLGVQRLEARAVVANARGNGALRKIGAIQEGVLRCSFIRKGQYQDQILWAVLAEDWRMERGFREAVMAAQVIRH